MIIKKLHLSVGIVCMVFFLLTGQYFANMLNGLQDLENTQRLLYRTTHAYLFFAAFINIIFGLYYPAEKKLHWAAIGNQCLVLLSPLLITYSFFYETIGQSSIDRKVGALGVVLMFVWLFNICLGKLILLIKRK